MYEAGAQFIVLGMKLMFVIARQLHKIFGFFSLVLCSLILNAEEVSLEKLQSTRHYLSWQGIEPDKWSSIWLIKRYISDQAFFQMIPPNTFMPDSKAIRFDMPNAMLNRTPEEALFSQIKLLLPSSFRELEYLEKIIYDIEVNVWEKPKHPHSVWFEAMFRALQERYQKDLVPSECYLLFFDRVADLSKRANVTSTMYEETLSLQDECPGHQLLDFNRVQQVGHRDILNLISSGKRIVFVDTREQEEFDEVHLPGAVQLRLRDVNESSVKQFESFDLVVPYCVKDFRGFEVAKAIKSLGVPQVATLSPNGLRGWLAAELPVVQNNDKEAEVAVALNTCATEASRCLGGSNGK